jgi:hypothetical protein
MRLSQFLSDGAALTIAVVVTPSVTDLSHQSASLSRDVSCVCHAGVQAMTGHAHPLSRGVTSCGPNSRLRGITGHQSGRPQLRYVWAIQVGAMPTPRLHP